MRELSRRERLSGSVCAAYRLKALAKLANRSGVRRSGLETLGFALAVTMGLVCVLGEPFRERIKGLF